MIGGDVALQKSFFQIYNKFIDKTDRLFKGSLLKQSTLTNNWLTNWIIDL